MACLIQRVVTLRDAIQYVPVRVMNEGADITAMCSFSWSTDKVCWTNWVPVEKYRSIACNLETDFYLRILVSGMFTRIIVDNIITDCYSVCLYNRNPFLQDLCSGTLVNFYDNLDCALLLQEQLANGIICMLGIPAYYMRVVPDAETRDITFKEYVLHNVESVKVVKLMCQDGTLPSSKPQMTEFDFDWDNDWEIEMSKREFAKAFGDTVFPKQRDIVYVPMMKRLYEVNSAYDEKNEGLMWRSVTWKLGLVKWTEKTNVDTGDFNEVIDCWAVNKYDDMWLQPERKEQERESGVPQVDVPTFAPTNLYSVYISDAIRHSVTDNEMHNIRDKQINHGSTVVARNYYAFSGSDSQVVYQNKWCGNNATVELCLSVQTAQEKRPLFAVGNVILWLEGSTLQFGNMTCELEYGKIYGVVLIWDKGTFTMSMNVYEHVLTGAAAPAYRIRPEMYKFDFEHGVCQTDNYNEDLDVLEQSPVYLLPGGCNVYGVKMYNASMSEDDAIAEFVKYVTKNDTLVFNDCVRPFEDEHGYKIK